MSIEDARGRTFEPLDRPCRVVSLVPSLTELVADLGLGPDELVGRTRFCVHPAETMRNIPNVGGTKDFKLDRVLGLDPDLVIANIDENLRDAVDAVEQAGVPAFVTHPCTVSGAVALIEQMGELLRSENVATAIVNQIQRGRAERAAAQRLTALYLIWQDPWMTISQGTFIHDMMAELGFDNVITPEWLAQRQFPSEGASRYPELHASDILALNPETILLSSEPFPFREKHMDPLRERLADLDPTWAARVGVQLVDGELFSWYGSRMVKAFAAAPKLI